MKLSFGSVMAVTLWSTIAQSQILPNSSGPRSSMPVSPDDRPLLSRPNSGAWAATGLTAGMPGPYLPDPNDPTRFSPTFPSMGITSSPFFAE